MQRIAAVIFRFDFLAELFDDLGPHRRRERFAERGDQPRQPPEFVHRRGFQQRRHRRVGLKRQDTCKERGQRTGVVADIGPDIQHHGVLKSARLGDPLHQRDLVGFIQTTRRDREADMLRRHDGQTRVTPHGQTPMLTSCEELDGKVSRARL